jgi:hypothetical protein
VSTSNYNPVDNSLCTTRKSSSSLGYAKRLMPTLLMTVTHTQSYVTIGGQSASLSWCQASGPQDQIFITVRQFRNCLCGVPSLTRRRVCRLQSMLGFASAVILRYESRWTHNHIFLPQIRDSVDGPVTSPDTLFPFRHLLRLQDYTVEVFEPASQFFFLIIFR